MTDPETTPAISGELLETVREAYKRWLGDKYDLGALDVVLSVAAAEHLDGDPCWLLVLSGSGAAKTETIMPLAGAGALVVSTITGEAALLSGTSEKDRAPDATGGLLRKLGSTGLLVIKDVTTIISMSRDARDEVLAALREIADGLWGRDVGTEGGKSLKWQGKIGVIGAVTTAWDSAHSVISSMGDRFVIVRIDSTVNRREAGMQALRNVGREGVMRAELKQLVGELLESVPRGTHAEHLTDKEMSDLLDLADIVTLARTAVVRDGSGKVAYAHAPEMPTRFTKQLSQVVRGGLALGMDRAYAYSLACRCAGESLPPLRRRVLGYISQHGGQVVSDVSKGLQMPRTTIERCLDELHLLGVVEARETAWGRSTRNLYVIAGEINAAALAKLTRNGKGPLKGDDKFTRNGDTPPRTTGGGKAVAKSTRNGNPPTEGQPPVSDALPAEVVEPPKSRTGEASSGLQDAWERHLTPQTERSGNSGKSGNDAGQGVTGKNPVTPQEVTAEEAVTGLTCEVTGFTAVTPKSGPKSQEGTRKAPASPRPKRRCAASDCRKYLPADKRSNAKYCSATCHDRDAKRRKRAEAAITPKDAS